MVNALRRMTDKELTAAIRRICERNSSYAIISDLINEDGPADVEFITAICKEILRREEKDKTPPDYLDLLTKYQPLDNFLPKKAAIRKVGA